MQPIDFSRFLESTAEHGVIPAGGVLSTGLYQGRDGIQFYVRAQNRVAVQDIVRLSERAFLFVSQGPPGCTEQQEQIVSDGDWIHIQFRLNGGGREHIPAAEVIETPENSCIVARYPEHASIHREIDRTRGWKVACLFLSPRALAEFLEMSAAQLPEPIAWLAKDGPSSVRADSLPLQSSMILAVNDILACPFRGGARRAYMRGKSLELLSTVIHLMGSTLPETVPSGLKLSAPDLSKLSLARTLMSENLESSLTLAQLARRVGLNRTKLALGFKEVYGSSVQAYWRDVRLSQAKELLRGEHACITEVALSLGYSEVSSFTRAFRRKFGVLPRAYKGDNKQVSHG